jgi:hypothetical protein
MTSARAEVIYGKRGVSALLHNDSLANTCSPVRAAGEKPRLKPYPRLRRCLESLTTLDVAGESAELLADAVLTRADRRGILPIRKPV